MKIHFREKYGSSGEEILYVKPTGERARLWEHNKINFYCFGFLLDGVNVVQVNLKGEIPVTKRRFSPAVIFRSLFLPQGYPDSVSEDYIAYQKWDTVQAFCSTITGTLSTHAILKGVGVGDEAVNALSATATWILKDGAGHFGRILFAWWKGSELDVNSKKWRLRADILNDLAMTIEVFALPYYPELSMAILCATSTFKAVVGVCGGATRAALTLHHARRNNLADVASKDSAQETCVNLVASFVGLFLLTGVQNSQNMLSILFFLFTCLHIFSNVRAVKSVCLRTFNEARYLIALEEYFKTGVMMSPAQVNRLERITVGQTVSLTSRLKMGGTARALIDTYPNTYDLESIVSLYDPRDLFIIAEVKGGLAVYFHIDVTPLDVIKAYFFAASYLQDKTQIRDRYWDVQNKWTDFLSLAQSQGKCNCYLQPFMLAHLSLYLSHYD